VNHTISVAILAGVFAVGACDTVETITDAPGAPSEAPPPPEPTTALEPEPAVPGITPRVKAELDRRHDGATGPVLVIAGLRGKMQRPEDWTTASAQGLTLAKSKDDKAQLAAAGDTTKLDEAVSALGLTECRWAPSESIAAGAKELAASAADGLCKRGGVEIPAAQLTVPDASLVVVGAWENGGDDAGLFATLRSVTGAAKGAGGGGGIAACCAALAQNRKSAPPEQHPHYDTAIQVCKSIQSDPQLAQVRATLRNLNVPAACR
jgi:hypothetical protein